MCLPPYGDKDLRHSVVPPGRPPCRQREYDNLPILNWFYEFSFCCSPENWVRQTKKIPKNQWHRRPSPREWGNIIHGITHPAQVTKSAVKKPGPWDSLIVRLLVSRLKDLSSSYAKRPQWEWPPDIIPSSCSSKNPWSRRFNRLAKYPRRTIKQNLNHCSDLPCTSTLNFWLHLLLRMLINITEAWWSGPSYTP